jgi:uncharacterized protein
LDNYGILTLDGGGTWALLQAMALGSLYGDTTSGREILRQFDYVAATSGGSIVLGCLLNDWSPGRITKFFLNEDERKTIFVAQVLRDAGSAPLQVVIPAYDYDRNRSRFFRSNPASASASGAVAPPVTIAQAVHASSNASIKYFDEPADLGSIGHFWDGGVTSYDNPVLAGLTEAIANGADAKQIAVLSLGTGSAILPLWGGLAESPVLMRDIPVSHLWTDLPILATSILADPPDAATFTAFLMMQHELTASADTIRHVRMNPLIQPVWRNARWEFPNGFRTNSLGLPPETMFDRLVKLDMDAMAQDDVKLIAAFGQAWIGGAEITNQLIRADGGTFAAQISFENFADAKARWLAL